MAEPKSKKASKNANKNILPKISVAKTKKRADWATILGLIIAVGLIFAAIYAGQSDASFINGPSFAIVILGTIAVTSVSYTGSELAHAGSIIGKSLYRRIYAPRATANTLISLAIVAKQKGALALGSYDTELSNDPFLYRVVQLTIDGQRPKDIDFIISQEIHALNERHKRTASLTKRAAETAPAMGLIGTLIGLVQMLANLESPGTIGPAMAIALLTTFYGAILGTVILAPLSGKLEKHSADETLYKNIIRLAIISISQQDNPRKLEMELNAALPPSQQINYFE